MNEDQELRLRALEFALEMAKLPSYDGNDITNTAEKLYEWVMGTNALHKGMEVIIVNSMGNKRRLSIDKLIPDGWELQ